MVFATYEAAEAELNSRSESEVHFDSIYKVINPYRADLYILAENLAQAALMACHEYGITIVTGNLAKMENRP